MLKACKNCKKGGLHFSSAGCSVVFLPKDSQIVSFYHSSIVSERGAQLLSTRP